MLISNLMRKYFISWCFDLIWQWLPRKVLETYVALIDALYTIMKKTTFVAAMTIVICTELCEIRNKYYENSTICRRSREKLMSLCRSHHGNCGREEQRKDDQDANSL